MLIPIGLDKTEVRRTPWITYGLIAANVLIFVGLRMAQQESDLESPILRWAFVPATPDALHLLTYMFVHAGWLHLIGNMLFLYLSGPFVEDAYGRILYSVLYLLSGLVAAGVHAVHNPESLVPTVGASGAIAGIMGAFLVRHARRRIVFLWMPFIFIPILARRVRLPAFVFLPVWFLGQLLLSSISGEESGVAVWAHIGGFLFGFVVALLIAATGFETKFIEPGIEKQVGTLEHTELLHAIAAGTRGDLAEARRATGAVLARDPANLDARRYAYEVALESRDPAEIGAQATRLLETYVQHGQVDLASGLIHEATQTFPSSLPPRFLLRAADVLARQGNTHFALDLLDSLVQGHAADPAALRALLQSAEIRIKSGDFVRAKEDLLRARSHAAYGPEWSALVEGKLAGLAQPRPAGAASGYRGSRPPSR
jgi:membrane associated rhomboid family serine protease